MKNLILIIGWTLLVGIPLRAQLPYKTFGEAGYDFVYSIVPDGEGYYYVVGSKGGSAGGAWLMRIDVTGHVLWDKTFPLFANGFYENAYVMRILQDGSLLLAGEKAEEDINPDREGIMINVKPDGELIWKKIVDDMSCIFDVIEHNGEILAVGFYDNIGATDAGIFAAFDLNGEVKRTAEIEVTDRTYVQRIFPTQDGNYILCGRTNEGGNGFAGIFFRKISPTGATLWTTSRHTGYRQFEPSFRNERYAYPLAVIQMPNGSFLMAESIENAADIGVLSFSSTGQFQQQNLFSFSNYEHAPTSLMALPGGELLITGVTNEQQAFVYRVTPSGQLVWRHYFHVNGDDHGLLTAVEAPDYFLLGGHIRDLDINAEDEDGWILGIGKNGELRPHKVRCKVWLETNDNCIADAGDMPLPGWFISTNEPVDRQTAVTDRDGNAVFGTDDEALTFALHNPDPAKWELCNPEIHVLSSPANSDTLIQFLVRQPEPCALVEVAIAQPDLVRCETSCTIVGIKNSGSRSSDELLLSIVADPELTLISSSLPHTPVAQGAWIELPSIGALQSIEVELCYELGCDVQLGATHEIRASINRLDCIMDYQGPVYTVDARCDAGQIVFAMENIGGGGSSAGTYYTIIVNDIIAFDHQYIALPEQGGPSTLMFPADGRTWQIEIEQDAAAPIVYRSNASLEACGVQANGLHVIGWRNSFLPEENDPAVSIIQALNTTAVPDRIVEACAGVGRYNLIFELDPLEFTARVRNANLALVEDVIIDLRFSASFDLPSFEVLASSYPYSLSLPETNVIRITMAKADVAHGEEVFVRFRARPRSDLVPDSGESSLLSVTGSVIMDHYTPLLLQPGFLNYSNRALDLSRPYYDYTQEITVFGGKKADFAEYMSVGQEENVFLAGTSVNYSGYTSNDLAVIKCKYDGQTAWTQAIDVGGQSSEACRGLLATDDGGCIVIGYHSPRGADDQFIAYGVALGWLDSEGNILAKKRIDPPAGITGIVPEGMLRLADGHFIIYGISVSNRLATFVMKINQQGDVIWTKIDENSEYPYWPFGGEGLTDGGFVLSGEYQDDFFTENYMRKFDANGEVLWSTAIESPSDPVLDWIVETPEHDIVFGGPGLWFEDTIGDYVTGAVLVACDQHGNQMWEKRHTVDGLHFMSPFYFSAAPDGYLLTGDMLVDTVSKFNDMVLMKLDADFNLSWYQHYGNRNWEIGYSVAAPDESTILLFGNNQPRPLINDIQWLFIPTDNLGNPTALKDNFSPLSIATLLPNPATEAIHLHFDGANAPLYGFVIMDMTGRLIRQDQRVLGKLEEIDVSAFSQGVYVIAFPGSKYKAVRFVIAQ